MLAATMTGLADYHMHTPLCRHATGHPEEYVHAAARIGLGEIGFACHSPMRTAFDDWRMPIEDFPCYLDMVAQARDLGAAHGVVVRLGLEIDYLPGHEPWIEELSQMAPWDYLIGSVHYLTESLAVDDPNHLSQVHATFTPQQVWETYWRLFAQAARTRFFDFMAHPDLPKKFGRVPQGDLSPYYRQAIEALKESDTAFEINTAGLRKPIQTPYPAPEFIRLGAKAGLPMVISSDAHAPSEVGAGFERAQSLARESGYAQLARFENRRRTLFDF